MNKLKDVILEKNNLLNKKRIKSEIPRQTQTNLKNQKPNIFPRPKKNIKQSKTVQKLQNLTHDVSQSMESIDRLNKRIQNLDDKNEPLMAQQLILPAKRSPRNSILPYSVFEDYLLFKCYLDKPTNPGKTHMRTRQSGHLGEVYFLPRLI